MTDIAAAWEEAGTVTVMLATGTEVRGMLPGTGALARRGLTPGVLIGIVSRLEGTSIDAHGGMSDEDWEAHEGKVRDLVGDFVTSIRPPGHEEFAPHVIEPEHRVPPEDLDALTAIVLRFESPAQVDARHRARLRGMPLTSAAAAWSRTAGQTLPAWESLITSDEAFLYDWTAHRYGCRPSDLLNIDDRVIASSVDVALATRALMRSSRPRRESPEPLTVPYDPAMQERSRTAHTERLRAKGLIH
ncbi:MAG: hypothetical protein LC798_08320 [Chloroflexi bacterium]|nr:hypothetical protein [Chloroflexota bacterium]